MKISLIAIAFICLWVSAFSQTTQAKTFEISSADVLDFQFFECIDSILENYSNYKFDYYMITFMDSIDRQHCAILSPRMKGNIDIIDVSGINTLDHHVYTKFYSSEPIVESIEKGNKYGKTYIDSCAIGNVNFKPLSGIGEINVPNTAYMQESLIYVTNLCGMTIFGTNLGHGRYVLCDLNNLNGLLQNMIEHNNGRFTTEMLVQALCIPGFIPAQLPDIHVGLDYYKHIRYMNP